MLKKESIINATEKIDKTYSRYFKYTYYSQVVHLIRDAKESGFVVVFIIKEHEQEKPYFRFLKITNEHVASFTSEQEIDDYLFYGIFFESIQAIMANQKAQKKRRG